MNSDDEILFSGVWLRWENLTQSEKVVCACIVCIPLWWLLGWGYILLLITLGLLGYHVRYQKGLRLHTPNWATISAFTFGSYTLFSLYIYNNLNNLPFGTSVLINVASAWLCPAFLLWYIHSHKIRVRFVVVAWAVTVLVIEMLLFWLFIFVVLGQREYVTSPTILGYLSGSRGEWQPGGGHGNYLRPYVASDVSIPGMVRYCFFFPGPEALATTVGFFCLLALNIRNRTWSVSLFLASLLLLLLSGTRSAWLAVPGVVAVRYCFMVSRVWGAQLVLALIAVFSFATLSLPPVTNALVGVTSGAATATGEMRGDSTEVRSEIYNQTIQGILNSNEQKLFLGHVVAGNTVLPGYEPAKVGSHSFLLGTLLYRSGLVGTFIFLAYWTSLFFWFLSEKKHKPDFCFLTLLFLSFVFCVMELEASVPLIVLLCVIVYHTVPKDSKSHVSTKTYRSTWKY